MGNLVKDYDDELEKEVLKRATEEAVKTNMEVADAELDKLKEQVRAEFKDTKKIFYTRVPYLGHYFFRPQTLADVRASDIEVARVLDEKIKEFGGRDAIEKMPEGIEKNKILKEIDDAVSDAANKTTLKRCILYPKDFAADVDSDQIESGTASLLLEKIMDVSGWVETVIKEV